MVSSPQVREARFIDESSARAVVRSQFPVSDYDYAANIRRSNCFNVVAETTAIVGFASLLVEATPELGSESWRQYPLYLGVIAIHPDFCRQKIGTLILKELARLSMIKASHHAEMHLHVSSANEGAMKFFRARGFETLRQEGKYSDGTEGNLMVCAIKA